jgi:hypothetical protein
MMNSNLPATLSELLRVCMTEYSGALASVGFLGDVNSLLDQKPLRVSCRKMSRHSDAPPTPLLPAGHETSHDLEPGSESLLAGHVEHVSEEAPTLSQVPGGQ